MVRVRAGRGLWHAMDRCRSRIRVRYAPCIDAPTTCIADADAFIRMWEFYFCYCEGGFEERVIGDVQMLLVKPGNRRAPIASD
jgi:hypothetical protein